MTLALTCALCLAGAAPGPGTVPESPVAAGLQLDLPATPGNSSLDLAPSDTRGGLHQHQHGDDTPQRDPGGHTSMMSVMMVTMVVMMVVVGGVMMSRTWRATGSAPAAATNPAIAALPPTGAARYSPSGG